LLAIGFGKLGQLLGGSGQGLPFDGPWAVAFLGDGPWVSANPTLPSHPSQVYEALWALIGIPIVLAWVAERRRLTRGGPLAGEALPRPDDGALFIAVLAWFLLGRVLVGFTWRDDLVLGPFNGEQLFALVALAGVVGYRWLTTRGSMRSIVSASEPEEP
jgi:prolipoprotein diacylglyceryltransferase